MNPVEWLSQKAPGFRHLSQPERDATMHFALLWSLFEAKALNTSGNASAILSLVHEWRAQGRLDASQFSEHLDHFKSRYFSDGQPTHHFHGLHLRKGDNPALVQAVLSGDNTDPADSVSALLIVVYRLRNNLFHGIKWADELRDQLANFNHANAALMGALDLHGNV
jgi:hypothetical protein